MMGSCLFENDGSWFGGFFWLELALSPAGVLDCSVAWLLCSPTYLPEEALTRALGPLIAGEDWTAALSISC
jgi:hypothetical protein